MHDLFSGCQPGEPFGAHVDPIVSIATSQSLPGGDCSFDSGLAEQPPARVPAVQHWVSTTSGRLVTDPYSWMQGVHWVHSAGLHKRFNVTTVRLAQILAELTPCRPGIEYLMRRLELSERAVQYHLAALRETGLLVYISKGTRRRGQLPQASVFARTLPVSFDVALGIRCTQDGPHRRVVGITESGRKLIAKLGKKASRKIRKPRPKVASKPEARCTPMEGGSVLPSLTHSPTSVPLETSGRESEQPTGERIERAPRRLSKVGRRFRLASELQSRIPWLARTAVARIAWVIREVADAEWTGAEVEAWLNLQSSADSIRRPSGFLAQRLVGAAQIWADPKARAQAAQVTLDSKIASAERHAESTNAFRPASDSNVMAQVFAGLADGQARLSAVCRAKGLDDPTGLPATPVDDDWDAATAALVAMFGDEARHILTAATPGA